MTATITMHDSVMVNAWRAHTYLSTSLPTTTRTVPPLWSTRYHGGSFHSRGRQLENHHHYEHRHRDPSKSSLSLQSLATVIRGGGEENTENGDDDNHDDDTLYNEKSVVKPMIHVEYPEEDSGNSVLATATVSANQLPRPAALVLMDVFCDYHGEFLAHRAKTVYGLAVVRVYSDYMRGYFLQQQQQRQSSQGEYDNSSEEQSMLGDNDPIDKMLLRCMPRSIEEAEEWCHDLVYSRNFELVGLVCDSDSGLADSERLSSWLPLTYKNSINEARRDKFRMNQLVGDAGIDVVKQSLCETLDDALAFASSLGLIPSSSPSIDNINTNGIEQSSSTSSSSSHTLVVVKPIRGCASDDVFLCGTTDGVRIAFETIMDSTVFGSPKDKHRAVLVQEFARGQEFAIDTVSKDGEMKIAAIWIYDKRPANGAPFVYYSTRLYDGEHCQVLYEYLRDCLTALDVRYGITHSEIILTDAGPRLVEVNCRQHNMDFLPLTMNGIGYNIYDMLLSAYMDGRHPIFDDGLGLIDDQQPDQQKLDWDMLPTIPTTKMNAAMVHLVNHQNGILTKINEHALREIQSMDSTWDLEVYPTFLQLGEQISPTVDIKSDAGWVQLIHPDPSIFERDYHRIVELMPKLFETRKVE